MRQYLFGLSLLLVTTVSVHAHAANTISIVSKTVRAGESNVSVGIYLSNDVPIAALVLPLELRSLDPGAFIAHKLLLSAKWRLAPWTGGSTFSVLRYFGNAEVRNTNESCTPAHVTGEPLAHDTVPDFTSPDGLLYTVVGVEPKTIAAGSDGTPDDGTPSLVISFDVTDMPGRFVIDTTCVPPANHVMMVTDRQPFDQSAVELDEFVRGVITISR